MKTGKRLAGGVFAVLVSMLPVLAMAADVNITVITPARTARAVADVPGSVEVVTGPQLESAQGVTLNDKLVGLIPGVENRSNGGIYSYNPVVTMRGMPGLDQGRTLVLLNGVPINTGATGSVDWHRLAEEDIDRVEVFKGPVSSLYGSNAVSGVINVITKEAAPGYRLDTSYGTYNTFQANIGAGAKIKNLSLSAEGGYITSDGYNTTPKDQRSIPDYTVNQYLREKMASVKTALDLGDNGIVDAQYSRNEELYGEGTRIRTVDGVSRQFNTDSARAGWHGDNGRVAWQTQAYYQFINYTRLNESMPSNKYTRVNTEGLRHDNGGQAAASMPLAGITATLGADYKIGSVNAVDHNLAVGTTKAYDDKDRDRMTQYAPYAQAEKKLFSDRLKLLAAMRYDNARYFDGFSYNPSSAIYKNITGPQSDHYWDRFSPKIAGSWNYSDSTEQYFSYGRGFRPPSLEDMCLTLLKGKGASQRISIANPDLRPETVDTAETGFKLAPLTGLYIEPAAYYTIGRDFIYSTDTGQKVNGVKVTKSLNVGKVKIYGAELPVKFYSGDFSVAAAYAWSDSEIEHYPGSPALEGKSLTYSPHQTVSASVGMKTAPADFRLGWEYKSKQYIQDDHSGWVRGYDLVSASASRAFTRAISAKLSLENIFDKRYQESSDNLSPGRTITVSVTGKF